MWSAWAKIWTSQNDYNTDPVDSRDIAGPNAYRLRGRTGLWYQNARSFITGKMNDRRIPQYQTAKDFNTKLRILEDTGSGLRYDIYISNVTAATITALDGAPFTDSPPIVKILDEFGNDPGEIRISNWDAYNIDGTVIQNPGSAVDLDYSNVYVIVTGTLEVGGNFESTDAQGNVSRGVALGDNTIQIPFSDYAISSYDGNNDGIPDGNIEVITLRSDAGEGKLIIGRGDGAQGSATTPQIWFRSSATVPASITNYYTAGMEVTGGDSNVGSGTLNVLVSTPNQFTVGSNVVWNEGNAIITSTNTASTYTQTFDPANPDTNLNVRSLVMRDGAGNFNAGTITASLTGLASLNLPLAGGTLTGNLIIGSTGSPQNLTVNGNTVLNGTLTTSNDTLIGTSTTNILKVDVSEEKVGIGTGAPTVKLDLYQITNTASSIGTTLLRLTNDVRNTDQTTGDLGQQKTFIDFRFLDTDNNGTPQVRIGAEVGENAVADSTTKEGSGAFVVYTGQGTSATTNTLSEKFRVDYRGYVGIGDTDPDYRLTVSGDIYTTTVARAVQGMMLGNLANNDDAPLYFDGATTGADGTTRGPDGQGGNITGYLSNFRVGNNLIQDDVFEITATDGASIAANGGTDKRVYKATPALSIEGSTNRVAINTLNFSGVDNSDTQNPETRYYSLNVQGDMNINGFLYQNNEEFVTSRWTESANDQGNNIYRNSKVGIGDVDSPAYQLDVDGDINMTGKLYVAGTAQWLDSQGIIKLTNTLITDDVTVPAGAVAYSNGPIEIQDGKTVTVSAGATWSIL